MSGSDFLKLMQIEPTFQERVIREFPQEFTNIDISFNDENFGWIYVPGTPAYDSTGFTIAE